MQGLGTLPRNTGESNGEKIGHCGLHRGCRARAQIIKNVGNHSAPTTPPQSNMGSGFRV